MIAEWLEKGRLKRERDRIRAMCKHDWHVTRTYKTHQGSCVFTMEIINEHDVYCPKCEAQRYGISEGELARIEGKRKADRLYKLSNTREFRKGDVVICRD